MRFKMGQVTLLVVSSIALGCGSSENPTSHWAGKTYLLDIEPNHWTKPTRDVGGEIAPFVPQFLFGITGTGTDLSVIVATASGGVQNLCNPTQKAAFSESQYPESGIALARFPMTFQQLNDRVTPNQTITVHSTLHDLVFTNILPAGFATASGTFDVTADIAELYPLFYRIDPPPPTLESVCNTLEGVGSPCETCGFNAASQTCLTLGSLQLEATLNAATVTQVSAGDIAATCP
jgi:hypothetical protein